MLSQAEASARLVILTLHWCCPRCEDAHKSHASSLSIPGDHWRAFAGLKTIASDKSTRTSCGLVLYPQMIINVLHE